MKALTSRALARLAVWSRIACTVANCSRLIDVYKRQAITVAKLPTLKRLSGNIAKCSTPLRIGNSGLDIYSGYDAKQPKNVSGYSSPMLNDFTGTDKVYIVRGYTYLHKGIDGPAWLTYQQFELD